MSRSTSQSSAGAGLAASGLARGRSVKTNTTLPPSDIRLYVTNLRLLDLDKLPDWPNITVQTFSLKNSDQKQRIGSVEWSLFKLFELWDPQETRQKLQPFFPALENLQSLNLRAALYRCLNDLKKTGVLGRESVLRKTMLDECKDDKLFDLLISFSNVVLRKSLSTRNATQDGKPVARMLATATTLDRDRRASLLPLAIAHKAALVNVLKRKDEKRKRFTDFEALLNTKATAISQRIRNSKATPRSQKYPVQEKEVSAIKKQLTDNWIGDRKWLETILHGDGAQVEDAFLGMHFNEVWPMVEQGCKLEDAVPEIGLLENLQLRVQEQQSRLQKWTTFHENLRRDKPMPGTQPLVMQPTATEFKFEDHLILQLQPSTSLGGELARGERGPLRPEYQGILEDLDAELLRVSQATCSRSAAGAFSRTGASVSGPRPPVRRGTSRSDSAPKQPINSATERPMPSKLALAKLALLESEGKKSHIRETSSKFVLPERKVMKSRVVKGAPPPSQPREIVSSQLRRRHEPTATPLDSDATLIEHSSATSRTVPLAGPIQAQRRNEQSPVAVAILDTLPAASPSPSPPPHSPSPPPLSNWPSEPPVLAPPTTNAEDFLAEQIISSIGNATPSPVKKDRRLSLLERTQLSMARSADLQPISESPSLNSPLLPELPAPLAPPLDRKASLVERTQLSMAAMSLKPPPTKDRRKSSRRESLFPVNQFDTPRNRKSFQAIEESRPAVDVTPKEVLFSDDIDYEHVFKSRPRIVNSPIFSPPQVDGDSDIEGAGMNANGDTNGLGISPSDDEFDEGITGVDLADVEADDENGFTQAWDNSPSRRAGGGLRGSVKLFD